MHFAAFARGGCAALFIAFPVALFKHSVALRLHQHQNTMQHFEKTFFFF